MTSDKYELIARCLKAAAVRLKSFGKVKVDDH